ncbi:MAG: hypothetical protein K8F59_17000 [Rhodobacteraceae bacterium]|nr:hypothetical protein [Paracoccaceae bacterium]
MGGFKSPGDYATFKFPPPSRHDHTVKLAKKTYSARSAVEQALRGINDAGVFAEAASSVSQLQKQWNEIKGVDHYSEQITTQQDAMNALSVPGMEDHLSVLTGAASAFDRLKTEYSAVAEVQKHSLGGIPDGYLGHLTGAQSAVSRMMEEMREHHRLMFQQVDLFAHMRRSIKAVSSIDLNSVLNIPRMESFYAGLGIDRIGQAFAAADAASVLGLKPAFNDEVRSVTSLINEQISMFGAAQEAASAAIGFDLSDKLEVMLARSIAAQEALLQEHREATNDSKDEAAFHRRNATISIIINILMFLMAIALQIEERIADRDTAVRANTEALQHMQQSFDGMASQLEKMQEHQETTSTADQAADREIADILRGIAATLAEQAETQRAAPEHGHSND